MTLALMTIGESGLWFFDEQVAAGSCARKDAEAQNVGYDNGRLARAVDAVIGQPVRRQSLRVECPEAGFIPE